MVQGGDHTHRHVGRRDVGGGVEHVRMRVGHGEGVLGLGEHLQIVVMISRGDGSFVSGGASPSFGTGHTVQVANSWNPSIGATYLGWAFAPADWPGPVPAFAPASTVN